MTHFSGSLLHRKVGRAVFLRAPSFKERGTLEQEVRTSQPLPVLRALICFQPDKGWFACVPLDLTLHSKNTLRKPLESLCGEEVDVLKQGPSAPMIQGTEAAGFAFWSQGEH